MSKESIKLSRMNCYAGKIRAEVLTFEDDGISTESGLYLQFVEGCGYTVYDMTPDEADQLADLLKASAAASRESFKK